MCPFRKNRTALIMALIMDLGKAKHYLEKAEIGKGTKKTMGGNKIP
jgi:hypothetical protein